ncbi:hypothetical protein LGL55_06175 [Clostridium tagluense]|uniref:hypothetical protein n=1 Tax=Clostridium tagluense TaxID=360422 RepID=UPI001C0E257A|nr:hypothetical protein [Clostridium tagluense]MBU3129387.1 hypothetical protein [Clostridium tagluense]MCB2310710.1 hypothetical protein [Clostridium tagluense]MCB2315560.1 hypothetical protein [Clostridium tagluense]MCB2320414.1 hypothetical protein [Clostridium tagluense]MCB2325303.1 hypothetical protein [Clostridium tagluense]
MEKFSGKPDSLKKLGVSFIISILLAVVTLLFIPNFTLKTILLIIFISVAWQFYKGIILFITVDDQKIRIYKPFNRRTIKFDDIAFCAVHGIDDDTTLLYAFRRKKHRTGDKVRGIKSNKSFDEIVKIISLDEGNTDLNINFNMASKVLISFVDKGDILRDKILATVNERHKKIL